MWNNTKDYYKFYNHLSQQQCTNMNSNIGIKITLEIESELKKLWKGVTK